MSELVEQISNFNADHPLSLLFDRRRTLADRAGDGSLPFVEAVDMAYSAASWAEAQRSGRLQIDDELELDRLLHR